MRRTCVALLALAACLMAHAAHGAHRVVGALSPHHDVAGALIDRLYARLGEEAPRPARVVVIGPDHFGRAKGNIVIGASDLRGRGGSVRGDEEGASRLAGVVRRQDDVARQDHCILEHVPRIRATFGDVPVLSVIVSSRATDLQILQVGRALSGLLRDGGVVILSMDLSHYKARAASDAEDARSLDALLAFRIHELGELDIDCPRGARLFLKLMRSLGDTKATLLERGNSSDVLRDATRTTGWATALFVAP